MRTKVDPAMLAVITKDDNVLEPDLSNENTKKKHRKHTRYKYSNQPDRFKDRSET